ncbi:MAG: hypothetical protein QXD25_02245 [Nanopusillaceae archaeon]
MLLYNMKINIKTREMRGASIGSIRIAIAILTIIIIAAIILNVPFIREILLQYPLLLIAFIIFIVAGILELWLKRS